MKVLDTDVCIEILRGNVRAIERRRRIPDEVATTWITACEKVGGPARTTGSAACMGLWLANYRDGDRSRYGL